MQIEHGIALLIFVGRTGDVLSTHFITPTMVLEANPIARRFKLPTFALGFLLCAVPYWDVPLGVMVAIPSLLVTASNLSRAWFARTLGEAEMEALILRTAARSSLKTALSLVWLSGLFFVLAAVPLWWLSSDDELAWYSGTGLALFGIVFAVHSSMYFVRVFRQAKGMGTNAA